jgi:hypothetical protein
MLYINYYFLLTTLVSKEYFWEHFLVRFSKKAGKDLPFLIYRL